MRYVVLSVILSFFLVASAQASEDVGYTSEERAALKKLIESVLLPKDEESREISDRNFKKLSAGWKRGVKVLLTSRRCTQYIPTIRSFANSQLITKMVVAQMITESACDSQVISNKDHGLLQVQERACRDVGVTGDLLDPKTNIRCGVNYLRAQCVRYRLCAANGMLVAYNAGPGGVKKVKDLSAHQYARKLDFVLNEMRRMGLSV